MAKKYNTPVTSPFGSALWAHLITPDTKFDPIGDYKINLVLDEAAAAPLIATILAEKEKALIFFQEEAKAKGLTPKAIAKIKLSDIDPFSEDDEDEDKIIFKFKRKAAYIDDSGEKHCFSVDLVDATGKTIPKELEPNVGNGSTVRVLAEMVPYNMSTSGVGISLRLKKVQIKDLVEYSADGPGFDAIEDGGYVPPGMDNSFGDVGGDSGYTV